MSFGGSSRAPSYSRRGSSAQKKEKRKKQDFHKHKLSRLPDETTPDFDELKSRVNIALDRLGHQVFSTEAGGYTFNNWMQSLNLLLDDFEEKAGPTRLPKEYYESRQRFVSELLQPVDTSELDKEIEDLRSQEEAVNQAILEKNSSVHQKMELERTETEEHVELLRKKQATFSGKLESTKKLLEEESNQPGGSRLSAFRRFFSRSSKDDTISSRENLEDLENKVADIEHEISKVESEGSSRTQRLNSGLKTELKELQEKREDVRTRLAEIERTRLEKLQLTERREETTKKLADLISTIKVVDA